MSAYKKILFVTIFVMSAMVALAQPPSGDNDGEDPDAIPIDGGVSVLLAAGAAFGVKKMMDKRKDQ